MSKEKIIPAEQQTKEQRAERMYGTQIINEAALRSYKPSPERQAQIDAEKNNRKRKT
jgi:hypothetical protein